MKSLPYVCVYSGGGNFVGFFCLMAFCLKFIIRALTCCVGSQSSVDGASSTLYPFGTLSRVPLPSDKAFNPLQNQQSMTETPHAMYATPGASAGYASSSVHARNAEPQQSVYSQSKSAVATPSSISQAGQRAALQRQPSHDQNGQVNAAADQRQVPSRFFSVNKSELLKSLLSITTKNPFYSARKR